MKKVLPTIGLICAIMCVLISIKEHDVFTSLGWFTALMYALEVFTKEVF